MVLVLVLPVHLDDCQRHCNAGGGFLLCRLPTLAGNALQGQGMPSWRRLGHLHAVHMLPLRLCLDVNHQAAPSGQGCIDLPHFHCKAAIAREASHT